MLSFPCSCQNCLSLLLKMQMHGFNPRSLEPLQRARSCILISFSGESYVHVRVYSVLDGFSTCAEEMSIQVKPERDFALYINLYTFGWEITSKTWRILKIQVITIDLIVHRFRICELTHLLKFLCNPQMNTHGTFMVICGHVQSLEKFE